jgi:Rad3-related DNA helicase
MSWNEKTQSIKNITQQIINLCDNHKNEKGIIQTGNYENAKFLFSNISDDLRNRCIFYFSSKDKNEALMKFDKKKDAILIGPTLLEGLNFPGDRCRFSICMKLPYANLSNNLVQAKKSLIKNWYLYDVMTKLEQGFGRGIRFNGDWCINYILDGCIIDLLKFNTFNKNIQKRIFLVDF